MTAITYRRVVAGHYVSVDDRVTIKRVRSQQTGHADEFGWEATIDGRIFGIMEDTLAEAKARVEKWIDR